MVKVPKLNFQNIRVTSKNELPDLFLFGSKPVKAKLLVKGGQNRLVLGYTKKTLCTIGGSVFLHCLVDPLILFYFEKNKLFSSLFGLKRKGEE